MLILFFALVMTCGYSVILREQKQTQSYRQEYLRDKNTRAVDGFVLPTYGEYNGTLSAADAMLMAQIQDQYMPLPRTIAFGNIDGNEFNSIEITYVTHGNAGTDEEAEKRMRNYITAAEKKGYTRFSVMFNSKFDKDNKSSEKMDNEFYIEHIEIGG